MKQVKISDLKSGLSGYLHEVRRGEVIVVMDRKTPVARVVAYEATRGEIVIRARKEGAPLFRDLPIPPPLPLEIDVLRILDEDRADRDLLG